MDINKYILEKALANENLCHPGATGIASAQSIDDLLKMYVKDIDYCLSNDFPSNDDLLRIGGDELAGHGIYVDAIKNLVDRPFIVLLGNSSAELKYSGYSVGQLFVKHSAMAKIQVHDNGYLIIDCFDDSLVTVFAEQNAKVLINVYGNATVKSSGSGLITITKKYKKSY